MADYTHADLLARVKAHVEKLEPFPQRRRWRAVYVHIEDEFNRHQPWAGTLVCAREGVTWPCADYASALALLDALDGGGS